MLDSTTDSQDIIAENTTLHQNVAILKKEIDELKSELELAKKSTVETFADGKYLDGVRQCCIELLSMNVGVKNVQPVILSVLKHIADISVERLPHLTTCSRILTEMKALSLQQVYEKVTENDNACIHSDGTTKFGKHYSSYQISTEDSSYSIGLQEIACGSAANTLEALKCILQDIELVAGKHAGNKVLASIQNTMSDRHVVQKNFNRLLEDYRSEILPSVIEHWTDMSPEERDTTSSLHTFFCGMHVIVGMADTAASTLKEWEAMSLQGPVHHAVINRDSEAGTVRLIRTACKAFQKHGSEQSGVYAHFTAFLKSNGLNKLPLAKFKGNRFNILFHDAGALFYIAPLVVKFLQDVWSTPNQLLRAVLEDIQVPEYLSACKALGLVSKVVTGPLWRLLESGISIIKISHYYQSMISKFNKWANDAGNILHGTEQLFDDVEVHNDNIMEALLKPYQHDATVQIILQVLFSSFVAHCSHLLQDHLEDGLYGATLDNPIIRETNCICANYKRCQ